MNAHVPNLFASTVVFAGAVSGCATTTQPSTSTAGAATNHVPTLYRSVFVAWIVLFALMAGGCSMLAPQYSASMANVQKLKDAGNFTAKVGPFESGKASGSPDAISLRGSTLVSPYQGSYAAYLGEAIKQELTLAGKLSPEATVEVSGILIKNSLDASGISRGYGEIEARFVVKKGGQVRYDQVQTTHSEWESSFAGAIAIPRAQQEYPRLVQSLLATLYTDNAFLEALK